MFVKAYTIKMNPNGGLPYVQINKINRINNTLRWCHFLYTRKFLVNTLNILSPRISAMVFASRHMFYFLYLQYYRWSLVCYYSSGNMLNFKNCEDQWICFVGKMLFVEKRKILRAVGWCPKKSIIVVRVER